MIALPDVNVLMALTWSNHPRHERAHRWFAQCASDGWATCVLTQVGFLQLSLNLDIVGVSIECASALSLLAGLVAHPNHQYLEAAMSVTAGPFADRAPRIRGYRQVTDATLLHLARSHGARLVTFDKPLAAICPWGESLMTLSS